jgi:hypothetical protein
MRANQQQNFYFFLGFSTLMFFLRFARNNPEFLFFDGKFKEIIWFKGNFDILMK